MNIYEQKFSRGKVFGLHILYIYVKIHNVNSNTVQDVLYHQT